MLTQRCGERYQTVQLARTQLYELLTRADEDEINNLRQEKVAAARWLDGDGQVAPPDLSFIYI